MNFRSRTIFYFRVVGLAALLAASVLAAQNSAPKAPVKPLFVEASAIARGSALYHDKCEICHFSNSEAQKLGPGLKGIYKRGTFANGKGVTDTVMEKWISDGSPKMPSYGKILKPGQIHDLIEYIRTL